MTKSAEKNQVSLKKSAGDYKQTNSRQAGRPREIFEIPGQVVKELEKVEVDFSVAVVCVF